MQLKGSTDIEADRERVFAFLTDPDRIGPCMPRVQSIRRRPDGSFEAVAKVGKGFISASFTLECRFTELQPPERAAIRATGKAKGSAVDATARMTLREARPGVSTVDWVADVTVSGLIGRLGSGRIERGAKDAIDRTLKRARKLLKA